MNRREALWQAGDAALEREGQLPGTHVAVQPPLLPELSPLENVAYDMWATGISTDDHPMRHAREALDSRGCCGWTGSPRSSPARVLKWPAS
ncbi:error-prone DNA polymerase [Arthrobacter sp. Hiyo8]|nr:error-prone DNA polymerase [Arthrobacter sp. Hiyo8]